MKISILTLIVLISCALCGSANASVGDGTVIPEATLASLSSWVEKATNVQLTFLPIAIASDRKLQKVLHVEDAQHAGAMGAYPWG